MQLLMSTENQLNDLNIKNKEMTDQINELNESLESQQLKYDGQLDQNMQVEKKYQNASRDLARAMLEVQESK